jgi:hypothetical protein
VIPSSTARGAHAVGDSMGEVVSMEGRVFVMATLLR